VVESGIKDFFTTPQPTHGWEGINVLDRRKRREDSTPGWDRRSMEDCIAWGFKSILDEPRCGDIDSTRMFLWYKHFSTVTLHIFLLIALCCC
jgi:hypothetical protein